MSTKNNLIIITSSVKQHGTQIYIFINSICLFAFKETPKVPTSNKHVLKIGTTAAIDFYFYF
jgi:hypothetical protein